MQISNPSKPLPGDRQPPLSRSRPVRSSQQQPHRRLERTVRRHQSSPWCAPVHAPTRQAFAQLLSLLNGDETRRLVLDAGCGTGASTQRLAAMHPDCVVIGVDKSVHRLARGGIVAVPARQGNCLWVRAELASFWRLALEAGWRLRHHYLLYPNPWPKPGQLGRRWHGHPVFPALLALGGRLELRCNWHVYAEEFARAAKQVTGQAARVSEVPAGTPISPFEAKYRASGHRLYRVELAP
jgi:tRNA G46 methylase TrmB